jgi:ribosome-binding factor A
VASRRILRINEVLRDELAQLLRHETDDPELQTLISITEVDTSPDLRFARVFFSTLADDEQTARIWKHLRKASRFFRRELAQRLDLRHTPELEFELDRSLARGARVLELLAEIQAEEPRASGEPSAG